MTWRDTDGDGLPDDWETFYGLNPLSTNGMHGASGDPDGDGFTNIEEYRLGSSPTSSAGLGYVFHRGNIGQLQVAIQDSTNCAGNNDSRQFVQRTIQFVEITNANMRPMEFTFRVSVTGRVERQNSGYDLVNVNDELVFGGSNEGMECQMANKSGDVLVKVMAPPGEIALSYDTVDSLFHVGAFARVTDIEMVDVNTNVLSIDIKFADPDDAGWADLEENIVILSDKNTRIKIKITPQLPDLQTIFNDRSTALKIKTSGTAPAGQDYTLTSQNTTLVQGIGYSEVRVSLTRDQLKTLGVLPSQEADSITEKAWLDHGSSSASAPSNLTDGNAFESGLSVETRGKSTHFGNLESSPPNSHIDKTFFIAAGREIITARFGNSVSPKRQIMNQADLFYYSGHGNHADAILQGGFAPIDVTGYWNKDLDCVIVAGCAVLDIKDYRAQSFLPLSWLKWYAAGGDWSPGAQWEPTGPSYLIGYNWTAPLDNQDSSGIISYFLSVLGNGASIVNAWKQANDLGVGRNACVIDCSTNPHVYWYWDETSGPAIWTNVIKSGGSW
ncbi:MAG: hypothetical protein GXY44_14245 [Phycisphaerales bacterium]|nr:hypothetical protein [Phycisphaerales bacterium]